MLKPTLRYLITIGRFIYGIYAWLVFLVAATISAVFALMLPGLYRRRRYVSAAARSVLILAGVRTEVRGAEHLPEFHCIVVANHASYLDGVILQAFLPPRFSIVAKGEIQKVPILRFLLRRIGARFVERHVTSESARDARSLMKAAAAGESLAIFPEGTFLKKPGLGRFRGGAFTAATKGGLPVVPMVIRGSRQILPGGTIFPGPGNLEVIFLEAINAVPGRSSAELAGIARTRMLSVLDEPDLAAEAPTN